MAAKLPVSNLEVAAEVLAELFDHAPDLVNRRFFDLTPSRFVSKTRLTAAVRLLRETDMGISAVARQCGFYDHTDIGRALHAANG